VATATSFFGSGIVGIYFVCTVERARRQGIAAGITLAALREARELGSSIGVLGSSEMGYPVYRRLGFEEYCRIGLYKWRPW
jgi:predicted acetyltransferase